MTRSGLWERLGEVSSNVDQVISSSMFCSGNRDSRGYGEENMGHFLVLGRSFGRPRRDYQLADGRQERFVRSRVGYSLIYKYFCNGVLSDKAIRRIFVKADSSRWTSRGVLVARLEKAGTLLPLLRLLAGAA